MTPVTRVCAALTVLAAVVLVPGQAWAHAGPPFPIVHKAHAGPYEISVWTDPDTTDDGTSGGQFWVMIRLLDGGHLPEDTRAIVTIRPLDREGPALSGTAEPVRGNLSRQFVALLMDHEGRFAVQATVSSRNGNATVSADVDATYDLRPPPFTLVLYAMPFVAIGVFWLKILRQRRRKLAAWPTR
jgi:hypothetical protein